MTKVINKITKEQEDKILEFIEKWVRKASEPIDRKKTVRITKELFGDDKTVLIAESIQNAVDLINHMSGGKKFKLGSQIGSQLDSQLRSQIYSQLRSQLRSQLDSQLRSQIYSQIRSQLDSQIGSQLDSQIYSQLYYSYYTTIYWMYWIGYYDYGKYIGVEFDEDKLERMTEIVTAIPTIIQLGEIMMVIENPICRWEDGMLHSDQLPAIEWKDGTGIYFLDGVKFEKELWKKVVSQTMSFKEIMAIDISDQRTVALKYNPEAIIQENATLVHKDNRNNELFLIEKQEINKDLEEPKIWFLRMKCPTGRTFVEGVPPEEAEKNPNATDMQALLCGLTKSEYMSMTLES